MKSDKLLDLVWVIAEVGRPWDLTPWTRMREWPESMRRQEELRIEV